MRYLAVSLCLLTMALVIYVDPGVASNPREEVSRHEGTVVHVTATDLVMAAKMWDVQLGNTITYHYRLAPNAKVTCDGMLCNLQDLRSGLRVRVTARDGGEYLLATWVEALAEQSTFPIAIARAWY